jgi:suppressor of tumorigenicity protein 13
MVWYCGNVGNLEEAIENLTEAILLNPTSAIMYGTRGTIWL